MMFLCRIFIDVVVLCYDYAAYLVCDSPYIMLKNDILHHIYIKTNATNYICNTLSSFIHNCIILVLLQCVQLLFHNTKRRYICI